MPGFWIFLWPLIYPAAKDNPTYFYLLIINHSLPFISVLMIILMGDIKMIEADWRSCLARTIFYFPLNAVGFIFTGNGVYGED